jgi:hypothetical protein
MKEEKVFGNSDLKKAQIRAEKSRELAEVTRAKVEKIRKKKEELLTQVTLRKLKEAEHSLELANLELATLRNETTTETQ